MYSRGATYTANAAITLYAVWKAVTYTVKYNANGGSGAPANQTKTHGTTLTLSSTKPTRANYTFKGWGTSASATTKAYDAGASYTNNAAITLYAVWELAYAIPTVSNLTVTRCDSSGTVAEEGTYALVNFDWTCYLTVSEIKIEWKATGAAAFSQTVTASGTSGSVSLIVGDGELSTESTYSFSITMTDSGGYYVAFATLNGSNFAIDFLAGGRGAAFGKPAELEGVLDIAFQTRFFGGILPPVLPAETDLNEVRMPNTYTGENVTTYNYLNCPVTTGTFTLVVESGGEAGQVIQTYKTIHKYKPEVFTRHYYQGEWGDWHWSSSDSVLLYDNESGSNGTIELAYSATHFRYLEIFYTDNNNRFGGYVKVPVKNSGLFELHIQEGAANVFSRQTEYQISYAYLVPQTGNASYIKIAQNGAVTTSFGTNYIKITRVLGLA